MSPTTADGTSELSRSMIIDPGSLGPHNMQCRCSHTSVLLSDVFLQGGQWMAVGIS